MTLLLVDIESAWAASLDDRPGAFEQYLRNRGVPESTIVRLRGILDSGQLNVFFELKKAEQSVRFALEWLTFDTEYLRGELEESLQHLRILFAKMDRDGELRRDRDVLHAGMLAYVGSPDAGDGG